MPQHTPEDYVVLVDENNTVVGTKEKLSAHHGDTPLHRGFSVFLYNKKGELLLQQRSGTKKTWPLVWSNSCCGHPRLDETSIDAAQRRLADELGITDAKLQVILPEYRYRFEHKGVVENEFCPVMVGFTNQQPTPNPAEVHDTKWVPWQDFLESLKENKESLSEWCVEEATLLSQNKKFRSLLQEYT